MSKTLMMYEDIRVILDQALAAGGGEFELATHGQAVHWRQRAYIFRKLFRQSVQNSPYDRLTFRKVPDGSTTVVIAMIGQKGTFRPATEVDELEAEANEVATALGIGRNIL